LAITFRIPKPAVVETVTTILEPLAEPQTHPADSLIWCGGNAINSKDVQETAVIQAMEEMGNHPCGCEVCFANAVIANVKKHRKDAGLDPLTGNMLG
jgi:hypothetical protein